MSTHHRDDILGPTSSIKGRLRGMFGQRSKVTVTPYPPTISMPTRMPIRNKRNFTEVTDDEQDRGSSINPRARARQRLDSTIPPHLVSSKTLSRKASNDSMRTICAREPRPSRTLSTSTIVLDPGRSAPARAVLTRTTTHNQLTPPPEDKASIPFPSKKRTLCPSKQQTTQSKLVASAKTPASPPTIPRESSLRKSKPLPAQSKFLSDSSPATPLRVEEEPGSFAAAMATEIPRSSQTRGTRITEPGPLSPEDIMLQQVLEYVVHETDDDEEEDEELDALLAASYARNVTRNSSLASMMSIDKHGNEFPALQLPPPMKAPAPSPRSPRMGVKSRLDRFDVRTQPCNNHTAIWDLEAS